ncbi:sugar transferase [Patescibacteria group bacterium]
MDTFSLDFLNNLITWHFWGISLITFLKWTSLTFLATLGTHYMLGWLTHSISRENKLRLSFVLPILTFLGMLLILRQSIFPLTIYSMLLGGFLGAFWETKWTFGLVEPNAVPRNGEAKIVTGYHIDLGPKFSFYDVLKRIGDIIGSLVIFLVCSPIIIAAVIFIWFNDPGPMLIAKVAVGWKGQSFKEYKFRTMVKQAEKHTGAIQCRQNDPRIVVPVGRLLRKTHLDELPQLFNVIIGDMSLVGPRPEKTVRVVNFLRQVPGYAKRHLVRPGITGWAQLHHTYYTPPADKLKLDLEYIERRNLRLDLAIVTRTIPVTFSEISGKGGR